MSVETPVNVVEYLKRAARRFPSRPALIMDSTRDQLLFAELWDRVDRLSSGWRDLGLKSGDRAICMLPMSLDLYASLLGLLKMGGVAVFVDPWIGWRQIAAFSAHAAPAAYIGVPKSHLLRALDPRLRQIAITVTTGARWAGLPARHSLRRVALAAGTGFVEATSPDSPALITFTSGSSGTPKGASRTHGFLCAQHEALRSEFPYLDHDVDMPMFPVFALNNLALGLTSVIPNMDFRHVAEVDPRIILDQMRRHGVTTCTASPPFFDRLTEQLRWETSRRPALRRILTGGAPVSDDQLRSWQAVLPDTEIVVVYGSTEAEPVAHLTAAERLAASNAMRPRSPGYCVGRPASSLQSRVVRIHQGPIHIGAQGWSEWELPPGEIGELVVSGRHVCRDYYRNPDAVAENKIIDAAGTVWHRMGDTGCFDNDSRFWLAGRLHSTVRRAGQSHHPQLIEQAASAAPGPVAAVGFPHKTLGESIVLVVCGAPSADSELRIRHDLEAAGLTVDDIVWTPKPLPLDPRHNSKVNYAALRQWLETRNKANRNL
jgi:acyl-CoA synthetase (AMP-forming)/AMP-acid ligase II